MDGASSKNFKKTKTPEEVKEALKHFVGTDPEVYVSVGHALLLRKQKSSSPFRRLLSEKQQLLYMFFSIILNKQTKNESLSDIYLHV